MIIFLSVFAFFAFLICIKGWYEVVSRKNSFGNTYGLFWMGIFVWGDTVVIAPFWVGLCLVCLFLQDSSLFWLAFSLFWVVRSVGETMYWMHEQFTSKHHNPPSTLVGYRFIKDESLWFIYQIFWQCMTVVSVLFSLFFAKQWVQS